MRRVSAQPKHLNQPPLFESRYFVLSFARGMVTGWSHGVLKFNHVAHSALSTVRSSSWHSVSSRLDIDTSSGFAMMHCLILTITMSIYPNIILFRWKIMLLMPLPRNRKQRGPDTIAPGTGGNNRANSECRPSPLSHQVLQKACLAKLKAYLAVPRPK